MYSSVNMEGIKLLGKMLGAKNEGENLWSKRGS